MGKAGNHTSLALQQCIQKNILNRKLRESVGESPTLKESEREVITLADITAL